MSDLDWLGWFAQIWYPLNLLVNPQTAPNNVNFGLINPYWCLIRGTHPLSSKSSIFGDIWGLPHESTRVLINIGLAFHRIAWIPMKYHMISSRFYRSSLTANPYFWLNGLVGKIFSEKDTIFFPVKSRGVPVNVPVGPSHPLTLVAMTYTILDGDLQG